MINVDELNLISSFYNNPTLNDVKKDEKKDYDLILAFVANLLLIYQITNEKMQLSIKERAIELKKATDLINSTFTSQIKTENKNVTDILKESMNKLINFRNSQSKNAWNISNKDLKNILDKTIEGKTYSDRIYDNKNQVAKILKKEIKDFTDGKTSVNEIKDKLQKKFNLNSFNTDRLVDNETSRVCRALDEQYFKDNNIQDLVYCAVLDQGTCNECFNLDGKEYKRDDPNRPKLVRHIKCRCFYSIAADKSKNDNKKSLVIDLQLFSYIKDKNIVINLVNQGMIDKNKFNEFRSNLNDIFSKGIKTPIKIINNSTDRAYHIAFKHRNLMNELGIKRIEEALKNPDLIKQAIDINGSQNDGYIKNFNGKILLVIAKDDIITAYYPSINYMKNKIDRWNTIWVKK